MNMLKRSKLYVLPLIITVVMSAVTHITFAKTESAGAQSIKEVYPGGMPFGIKLYTDGLLVVGFSEVECDTGSKTPAADAGIKVGDIITKINGEKITSSESFVNTIENCESEFELTYTRGGEEHTARVKPSLSAADGKYKTGMWLRDSTAGIGTVTYIDSETGEFAGLGHGICDAETGEVIPLMRGIVTGVKISGVKIGTAGDPGELKGYFTDPNLGVILKNTSRGVFGIYNEIPNCAVSDETVPLGERCEVHVGKAHILSTVDSGEAAQYSIEISKLPEGDKGSNFEICVTDEALIKKTGGIVQGMSGSPIIQDGKLIGAVTHVMISDPTRGYGIFIESMIDAGE